MSEPMVGWTDSMCIAGVGARTPLGLNAASSAAAVRASLGAIQDHPFFVDKSGAPISVAIDAVLSPDVEGVERIYALAFPAVNEALSLLASVGNDVSLAAFVGLSEPRPGRPPDLETELTRRFERDFGIRPVMIAAGHSAGLMALEEAVRTVQSGRAQLCLVGGVDSYLEGETLEWLDQEKQLLSAQNRSGFVPGEGAGFCLVTSAAAARHRGLDVQAWIVAAATRLEHNVIKTDDICVGKGLSEAISHVSSVLKLPEEKINATYCDLNGERYRSEEFTFTVLRTQSAFVNILENVTPADCWGDVGAASGPLFASLAVASGVRGYASGPRALLWTSSERGHRSAALLHLRT